MSFPQFLWDLYHIMFNFYLILKFGYFFHTDKNDGEEKKENPLRWRSATSEIQRMFGKSITSMTCSSALLFLFAALIYFSSVPIFITLLSCFTLLQPWMPLLSYTLGLLAKQKDEFVLMWNSQQRRIGLKAKKCGQIFPRDTRISQFTGLLSLLLSYNV